MLTESPLARRTYAIHGIELSVSSPEAAALEAMDLRLRGFPSLVDEEPGEDGVRLELLAGPDRAPPPEGDGRPVYDTPHGTLFYHPADDVVWGELSGVTLRCEAGRGVARISAERLSGLELYLATHPLATISLMELLERRGLFSLHAACVAGARGTGVLLAGPSGTGKSTLALACARAGMSFLSDDVVFLAGRSARGTSVLGFSDSIGVTEATAARFGELHAAPVPPLAPGFPKRLARIEELLEVTVAPACAAGALVFPRVAPGEPSAITALDGREAMLRLVPDVLLTEPAATQAHLQAIAALLERVDCFELTSGADLERAAELVRALA